MTDQPPPDGYFYDDLSVGTTFPVPAAVTATSGLAAAYLAISGDALPLSLDRDLCRAVTGSAEPLVNPLLAMHVSIGASTVATRNVLANLFYRNVVFRRPVFEGETLRTTTTVVAMSDARPKTGTPPRGKVLLGITTAGVSGMVIDYQRCALLPCRGTELPGRNDSIVPADNDVAVFDSAVPPDWDLSHLGPSPGWTVGGTRVDPLRDVVDQATSLVRLTHNLAAVHRDVAASPYPRRLVYGGHPVSLAQASLIRLMPGIATVVGWLECNHVGPVFEGDTLQFSHTIVDEHPVDAGCLRTMRTEVTASFATDEPRKVLDWRYAIYTAPAPTETDTGTQEPACTSDP